ncbi:MAG: hypothetical protein ACD_79C00486G0002 [uncultured bacterium]|nr:MAG: hypothetical protein ACD_79C00486G0002 [uncultured bacterium]
MKTLLMTFVIFSSFLIIYLAYAGTNLKAIFIHINDKLLTVEVADNISARVIGLSNRKELAPDAGMLFVFGKAQILTFWMKDTAIPLSVAFIGSDFEINSIKDLTPYDLTGVKSDKKSLYALEVNKGWFEQNKIKAGDKIVLGEEVQPNKSN